VAPSVLIAIPAFNEAKFIADVLGRISATTPNIPILVVNDGSTDGTCDVVRQFDVHLVEHQHNLGKGEAIKTVLNFAREKMVKWVIFLDGDGQHPPESLPDFMHHIGLNAADVVLGNRQTRTQDMPFHRQLSNGMTSILISLCAGQRVRDSQCGFRAVRLRCLTGIEFGTSGFQVESEMLLKLGKKGARFEHVPIKTLYGQESSSINLMGDTLKFVKLIINSFWW
jgi:glycosyltransferase involved in cell wall biosynthesis